jgi:hypothetical protein
LVFDERGNWRRQVKELFAYLEAKCEKIETNKSCGFHVHLSPGDGERWNLEELKRICFAIYYFEEAFMALLPVSRRHSVYISSKQYDNAKFAGLSIEEC